MSKSKQHFKITELIKNSIIVVMLFTSVSYAESNRANDYSSHTKIQQIIKLINKHIPIILASKNATGAEVALVNDNGIIWDKAYGYLSAKHKKKVNLETIFSMESNSKVLTATGVLLAAQKHLIDLNVPISSYLPNYSIHNRFSTQNPTKEITLKNLLSHTAGLAHEAPVGNNFLTDSPSFAAHVASIQKTWLRYPVGQRFAYSNLSVDLAGYILQLKLHMSFVRYMQKYVLKPLKMNQSTFNFAKIKATENRAIGTIPGINKVPLKVPMLAAGGLYSNAKDIAKYIIFQLNNGKIDGQQLLRKKYIKLMRSIAYPIAGQKYGHALGVFKVKFGKVIDYNKNGGGFGFNSTINWCPKYNIGFVMLFNGRVDKKMNQLTVDIFKKAQNRNFVNYDTITLKPYIEQITSKGYLKYWQGNYIGNFGAKLKLKYSNNNLYLLKGNRAVKLVYLGKNEFYAPEIEQLYKFVKATKLQPKFIFQVSNGDSWDYNDGPNDKVGVNRHKWENWLGRYQVINSTHSKISVILHIKNGWLYLDNKRLKQFKPRLFVDCQGHVLNLRHSELSWNNLKIKKSNRSTRF